MLRTGPSAITQHVPCCSASELRSHRSITSGTSSRQCSKFRSSALMLYLNPVLSTVYQVTSSLLLCCYLVPGSSCHGEPCCGCQEPTVHGRVVQRVDQYVAVCVRCRYRLAYLTAHLPCSHLPTGLPLWSQPGCRRLRPGRQTTGQRWLRSWPLPDLFELTEKPSCHYAKAVSVDNRRSQVVAYVISRRAIRDCEPSLPLCQPTSPRLQTSPTATLRPLTTAVLVFQGGLKPPGYLWLRLVQLVTFPSSSTFVTVTATSWEPPVALSLRCIRSCLLSSRPDAEFGDSRSRETS